MASGGSKLKWVTRAGVLLALTLAVQSLRLGQAVTGSTVNAMLLTAAVMLGPWGAAAIGLLTPVTAFFLGVLNPILAPAIPFIMAGNAALVLIFGYGRKMNLYLALIAGAAAKYLLLAAAVTYIISLPGPVSIALRVPQLLTALGGGLIALLILEGLAAAGVVSRSTWPGLGFGRRQR